MNFIKMSNGLINIFVLMIAVKYKCFAKLQCWKFFFIMKFYVSKYKIAKINRDIF